MTFINPYLNFDGNAREAFEFYQSVFGGKLDVITGAQFGLPPEQADRIMHAHLETADGWTFMGADGNSEQCALGSFEGFNICIGGTAEEIAKAERWFETLAQGGHVNLPLEKQQWGDTFGNLTDKLGVSWSFNFAA